MAKRNNLSESAVQAKRFSTAMITPTFIVLAIMTVYPLLFTFVYSFTDYNLLGTMSGSVNATGIKNYTDILTDGYFQQSVWNTVKFTILTVVFEMLVGFIMALFVNSLNKGRRSCVHCCFFPTCFPR